MKLMKLVPVFALALLAMSCAPSIPQADVDAANAAFNDAKTAQADVYAPDSFRVASNANDALQSNLSAKDYGKTADLAKAVVETSNKAKADVAAGIETVKTDVATLTTDVTTISDLVKKELDKAVKAGKKAKIDVAKTQADVAAADQNVTDAKTAADASNFADAKTKLTAAKTTYTDTQTALEAAGYKN